MTLLTSKARGTPREPLSYLARFASVGGGAIDQIGTLELPSVVAAAQSDNLSVSGVVS